VDIVSLENEEGRVKANFDTIEPRIYDRVIYAIGGTTPSAFLASSGIKEEDGKPVHDANYETNIEGRFCSRRHNTRVWRKHSSGAEPRLCHRVSHPRQKGYLSAFKRFSKSVLLENPTLSCRIF